MLWPTLRFSLELPLEESRGSLSLMLNSVLSLRKLSSLSSVGLLPRLAPSISTMIVGGGACFGCGSVAVSVALALAG